MEILSSCVLDLRFKCCKTDKVTKTPMLLNIHSEENHRIMKKQVIKHIESTLLLNPGNSLYAAKMPHIALQIKNAFAIATICSSVINPLYRHINTGVWTHTKNSSHKGYKRNCDSSK